MLNFNTIMRKSYVFFYILFLLSLIACSNEGSSKLSYTDIDTIKEIIKEREDSVSWTKDIEAERLDKSLAADTALYDKEIKYNHQIAKLNRQKFAPVYPEYPEFGSLDTRLLSVKNKETVQNFCQALSDSFYTKPQNYFDNSYIFNFVFFREELVRDWPKNFEEAFPIEKSELASKNESEEELEQSPLFSKWILGEPFISEEITQLPVRFYCNRGILDVTLYLNKKALIYQVAVERWEKL